MEARDRPYSQFNFLVELGDGTAADTVQAGFQEVSGLGLDVRSTRYRAGNFPANEPLIIHHGSTVSDVTLKRGVIGTRDLWDWLEQVRAGDQDALRNVTIKLLSEDHSVVATTWTLRRARPISYRGPLLHGEGGEVAIESITLAAEGLEIE